MLLRVLLFPAALVLLLVPFALVRRPRRPAAPRAVLRIPPGPVVLPLGAGWVVENHTTLVRLPMVPGKLYRDPGGRLLVSPNRKHAWVWPPRLCGKYDLPPCAN